MGVLAPRDAHRRGDRRVSICPNDHQQFHRCSLDFADPARGMDGHRELPLCLQKRFVSRRHRQHAVLLPDVHSVEPRHRGAHGPSLEPEVPRTRHRAHAGHPAVGAAHGRQCGSLALDLQPFLRSAERATHSDAYSVRLPELAGKGGFRHDDDGRARRYVEELRAGHDPRPRRAADDPGGVVRGLQR